MAENKPKTNLLYDLLAPYLFDSKILEEDESLYSLAGDLLESGTITRVEVIQGFARLLEETDNLNDKYSLMYLITWIHDCYGKYGKEIVSFELPEAFWLILKSNILFELKPNVSLGREVTSQLTTLTGSSGIVRSYFIQVLLTEDKAKWKNILSAFYPIHHTLESLKAISHIMPEFGDDSELYFYTYYFADSVAQPDYITKLSEEDRGWLKTFFETGLTVPNAEARKFAASGLQKLEEVLANLELVPNPVE